MGFHIKDLKLDTSYTTEPHLIIDFSKGSHLGRIFLLDVLLEKTFEEHDHNSPTFCNYVTDE